MNNLLISDYFEIFIPYKDVNFQEQFDQLRLIILSSIFRFMIMEKPHVKHGSKHYFQAVYLLRDVLKDHKTLYEVTINKKTKKTQNLTLWEVGKKRLARNGFWAMYEPMLLTRMLDDDREIRKSAFKEIKAARKYEANRKKRDPNCLPRQFKVFRNVRNIVFSKFKIS